MKPRRPAPAAVETDAKGEAGEAGEGEGEGEGADASAAPGPAPKRDMVRLSIVGFMPIQEKRPSPPLHRRRRVQQKSQEDHAGLPLREGENQNSSRGTAVG
jgi:hypothetical protein